MGGGCSYRWRRYCAGHRTRLNNRARQSFRGYLGIDFTWLYKQPVHNAASGRQWLYDGWFDNGRQSEQPDQSVRSDQSEQSGIWIYESRRVCEVDQLCLDLF